MEEEKRTHKEAIDLLEETVKVLEEKTNKNKIDQKTTEIQTDISNLEGTSTQEYLCGDCDYATDCIHDFNDHTHSPEGLENLCTSLFTCKFCDDSFETLPEVMKHNRIIHTSSVQHCEQFNICFYGDKCWFIHSESFREKFRTKNNLREHMKCLHIQFVAKCKNEVECRFGPKICWFNHKEDIEIAYQNAKSES